MLRKTLTLVIIFLLIFSTFSILAQLVKAESGEIIVDTEKTESMFTTSPPREYPNYWIHVQDHDTFHTRAYSGNFWYTLCGAEGTGEPLYYGLWQASLPYSGVYEVFVWIPNPDPFEYDGRVYTPTQSAIYQIYHKDGMTTKTVNQSLRTGGWYSVGTFTFDTTASVILNDRTGESYLSTMIAFDAIKFVYTPPVNNPPYTPYNPSPSNHAIGVPITADLSWSAGDPDAGDTVTYDVYFGVSSSPPLVSSGQSATTYDPGTLSYGTTYYWKIVATDNHGASTGGPVWDFTTQSPPRNQPPYNPTALSQLRCDGVTVISEGGTTPESTVIFKATVSDPDGDSVRLEIELRQIGEAFTGQPTPETISNYVSSGTQVTITRYGLVNADYHWRYRAKDIKGNVSDWTEFGTAGNIDFSVSVANQPPKANFTYSPLKPLIGEEITFNASASYDPDGGTIVNYHWVFYSQTGSLEEGIILLPIEIIEGADKKVVTYSFGEGYYLVELTVTDDESATNSTSTTMKVTEDWTFAVITDIHMGYYYEDYGTLSWNDAVSDGNYQLTTRLKTIVNWINSHEESNNIHFVAVLGDISDSGEKSELLKARDILNGLNVPYIPVIGNHDIWPYTQLADDNQYWRDLRFPTAIPRVSGATINPDYPRTRPAIGDQFFDEIFWQQNNGNREKIEKLFGDSFRKQTDPVEYKYIQNYAFTYKGIKFIALDFVDRNPTEDTQSAGAKLNADTEWWLGVNLSPNEKTILLSHHPMFYDRSLWGAKVGFSKPEAQLIGQIIKDSEAVILKNFAGHTHRTSEVNKGEGTEIGVVIGEAVCRESCSLTPGVSHEKKNIRLVTMTLDRQMKSYRTLKIEDEDMDIPHWWSNIWGTCPIDLEVTDPDGFTITKELGTVAGMSYFEGDWDGNGELDDMILIDYAKTGNYRIYVISEPGALPTDTYTLQVFGPDAATILAENISISDIQTEPYIVNSTVFALNVPPTTLIEIGEPKVVNGTTYVTSATPIDLPATDNPYGSGLASTTYNLYNDTFDTGWTTYINTIYLTGLSDGTYQIDYYSTDYVNNTEPTNTATLILDNTLLVINFTVSGTVQDKQGNPITDVLIVAQDVSTEIDVASATSNATGGYAMTVPLGTYNLIVTPPPESEFGSTTITNIEVTADVVIDIVLVPAEPVTFGGVVVDRDGNPVPNQYLELYSSAIGYKYVYTDEQGLFSLNVPTGIYTLYMYGGQGAPNVPYSYYLYRYSLNFTEDTFMNITLQTRYLTGNVVDPDGNLVANVTISARAGWTTFGDFQGGFEARATSDSEGKFNLTVFACPEVSLVATPPADSPYGAVLVLVDATEDSSVTVTLMPPVTFGGVVVDRDGNPVPNQYLELYSSAIGYKYVYTDEQGLFSLNVPTGIYTLYMYGGQGAPNVPYSYYLYRYSLNFTEDTFMNITLQTRYLTGKVDIEGKPVANVTISARAGWTTFGDFQGGFEARATSDSEGKFNLTVFACPSVSLTATPPPESPLATVNIANIDVTKDKTVLIALFYKAGVLPTANFTWTPETPEVGQSITFNASSSEAGSGIIIRHKWSFGDGTYAVGKTVMHSYASPGVYTVTLNVTNSKGLWDVEQKQIHIAEIGPGPKPPVASFTYTPANPIVDQEITFNATTSYDPDGVIVSYNWNFGDGITTTTSDPLITHSYSEEGNYKVTLTVVDNDGESSSTSETVTVVKPLTAPIETSGLVIKAMSPVDLVVIDPDYLVISKEFNEIPNAVYMEKDLDGDGSLDDYIFIPEPKRGQYIITVIPEPGADPTATYTLEVSTRDATLLLAENVPISDIPTEPYIISPTTFETPPVTLLTIGEPQYIDQLNNVYVSSTTPFVLTAEDNPGGSGVMSTSYRIYNDTYDTGWLLYAEPFNLTGLADGTYRIDYNSTDNAGNVEPTNTVIVILDNTPPTTTLTIGEPKYVTDIACVTLETSFTLEADDDTGSGVALTEYRVDYGKWTRYTDPFTVPILGQHALEYRSVDNLGNTETPQSVSIVVGATSLTYVGDTSGQYSDPTTVRAQLINMATQQPISGKNITFTLGIQSASAITDVNGVATTSIILNQPASGYTILAVFAGGTDYLESSNSCPFTINKEDAKVEYTGDTVVPTTTKTITLRATVFDSPDSNWGDLTKIQVTFRIYTAPIDLNNPIVVVGPLYVTQTETPGIGVVVKQIPNLSENDYVVIICIEPNDYYSGPTSDPIPVTVYTPTGSFVTGGGWIWDPTGSHGNFGFIVRYTKTGTVQGHSVYIYRSGDWVYIVKSNAWIGLAIKSNYAYFEGKCTIQMYNPATGELVWSVGNYQFRVDTWDNTPNGGIDVYQIRIRDKNGVVYHEAGFSPYGYLQGGNVIIHNAGKTGTAVTIATEEERNWF